MPVTIAKTMRLSVQRFVMQPDMPVETALRVYRRYLKLEPSHTEEYIAYLKSKVNSAAVNAVTSSDNLFFLETACFILKTSGIV